MDFNILHPSEPGYREVAVQLSPISLFKQELLMLLEGKETDVLGDYENWIDIEALVFKSNINENDLNAQITAAISSKSAYASEFRWSCNVQFVKGNNNEEIGIIQIDIFQQLNPQLLEDNLTFVYTQ